MVEGRDAKTTHCKQGAPRSHLSGETPENQHEPNEPSHSSQNREKSTGYSATFKPLLYYSEVAFRWACHLMLNLSRILSELHIYDIIREIRIFLSKHPLAAVIAAIITISCGIPVLIFVIFAIITIVFTFGGFLIIEGAILAAGSFALVMCLTSMIVVFVTLGFLGGLLYVTYVQVDSMVRNSGVSEEALQHFNTLLPRILASLHNLPHSKHQHGRGAHNTMISHTNNGQLYLHDSKRSESHA